MRKDVIDMKFRIHCEQNDYSDSIDIEEDTIEEIREIATLETGRRGWKDENCWSEEIK